MAWAIVGSPYYFTISNGGSNTITATTAGTHLICIVNLSNNGAVSSITDGGDAFQSTGVFSQRGTRNVQIWYAENGAGGKNSIVINYSGGGSGDELTVYEVSGLATSSSHDVSAKLDDQPATTTPVGAAVTTTAVGDFIVSYIEDAGTVSGITGGNEFTNDRLDNGNAAAHITSTSATAASHQAQWNSTNSAYQSVTASFFAAVVSGSIQTTLSIKAATKLSVLNQTKLTMVSG